MNVEGSWKGLVQPMPTDAILVQKPENYTLVWIRVDIQQPAVDFIAGGHDEVL